MTKTLIIEPDRSGGRRITHVLKVDGLPEVGACVVVPPGKLSDPYLQFMEANFNAALLERAQPLTTRDDPETQTRDFNTRAMSVRASTADDATRSVDVTMTTENPVAVYDWQSGTIIDEVLLSDGGDFPTQLPLLDAHMRYSLDNVLGSVRSINRQGSTWSGRAFLASGDAESDKAWNKVRQGHLTDVSVGYRATDYVDIPAGQTQLINGRSYTAGVRTLRISKRWQAKELSLVPIGADRNTKVREHPLTPGPVSGKEHPMNPQLRKYLESIGLRHDASDDQANAFLSALGGEQKVRSDAIGAGTMTLEQALQQASANVQNARSEPANNGPTPPANTAAATVVAPVTAPATQRSEAQIREEAARAERTRITAVRSLAPQGIPAELIARAENEGWDQARAAQEYLQHINSTRSGPLGNDAPAGIVRDHERDCTRQSLAFAMVQRSGVNVETWAKRQNIQNWQNLAQQSDRYRFLSMIDVVREALRIDGRNVPHNPMDMIREAVSGGSLANIFTTSAYATLLMAWEEEGDSTEGWIAEADLPNFLTHSDIDTASDATLKKLARGRKAEHSTMKDGAVTYKIARYGKQFAVDEQDIIDDRFDVLVDAPRAHGLRARQLRPNLVYALLLANASVTSITGTPNADGTAGAGALFNSTALTTAGGHANLGSDVLASAGLKTGITAMGKQYRVEGKNKIPLNIAPRFLIVPPDLRFTAAELLQSAAIIIAGTAGSVTERGTANVLQNILELRVDQRISATGVVDPSTGTAYTGSATNWFLAAPPNGRTIKVVYRQGTNRSPVLRSYVLNQGQWGIGWDINLDIGATAIDYPGLYKGNA